MKSYKKKSFPVERVRQFLEPGPVVLVSSRYKGETNIMTMGWHMIMEFEPSLIGCYIWDEDYSQRMIRKSGECVINIPEVHLAKTVVGIGNTSGADIDKFKTFELTPGKARKVEAPLIRECYANLECRVVDTSLVKKFSLFILECVYAHAAVTPLRPKTIHYRGRGEFMVAGRSLNLSKQFRPEMLGP